jgi:hypothetical protein
MKQSSPSIERVGAVAGVVTVVLLVLLVTLMANLPAPNKPIADIARSAANNRDGLLLGTYLGALGSGALMIFGTAVAARLRGAEGHTGSWWILALAGATAAGAIGFVSSALTIVLVRAVGHGVSGGVLWLAYGGEHWIGVLTGIPLAVFLLGAALGARAGGALPRWIGVSALIVAALMVAGAGSVVGDETDGGPLGMVLVLAYLGLFVWMVGVSVVLWRRPPQIHGVVAPSPA